jgi:SpoVK/Ycf46/Vps4 family AAA+-type ATPase
MRVKYELLGRDSPLSFEYETAQFAEIGGMRRLRQWIEVRRSFFREGPTEHLDPPRGILSLGVQGCGKSLAAKAAAGIFGVPLLRLDFGVLYSKYYGETEKNLRKALETAEVMAPCVLWLDEIEKGLGVEDDDNGLSRRVLGTLLTWMAERRKPVFLVATANDITRFAPEMVGRGASTKSSSWICRRPATGATSWASTCVNAASTRPASTSTRSPLRLTVSRAPRSSRR